MANRVVSISEYFVGQQITTQGEVGEAFFVLRRGTCAVHVDQRHVCNLEWGMGFGEVALVLDTMRVASIVASTPCEVFMLSRTDYEEAIESFSADGLASSALAAVTEKFWLLMLNENKGRVLVDYALYMRLHLRIAKTLLGTGDDFDEEEERESTEKDWAEDCDRHGLSVTADLDKKMFTNALFALVSVWADGTNVSYADFLVQLFDSVAHWKEDLRDEDGQQLDPFPGWRFSELCDVIPIGDELEEIKANAMSMKAAFDGKAVREATERIRVEAEEEKQKAEARKLKVEIAKQHLAHMHPDNTNSSVDGSGNQNPNHPWTRVRNADGTWSYVNADTPDTRSSPPDGWDETNPNAPWVRAQLEDGSYSYVNMETGESRSDAPDGWVEGNHPWVRVRNANGTFSYVNRDTGATQSGPPDGFLESNPTHPWTRFENADGTFSFVNVETGETLAVAPGGWGESNHPWTKVQNADGSYSWANGETGETRDTAPDGWIEVNPNAPWCRLQLEDGNWCYFSTDTGKVQSAKPTGWEEQCIHMPPWVRRQIADGSWCLANLETSRTIPGGSQCPHCAPGSSCNRNKPWALIQLEDGSFAYMNTETGQIRKTRPEGWIEANMDYPWVQIGGEFVNLENGQTRTPSDNGQDNDTFPWIRTRNKDGSYSYRNCLTGEVTDEIPAVWKEQNPNHPWEFTQNADGLKVETGDRQRGRPAGWVEKNFNAPWTRVLKKDGSWSYLNTLTGEVRSTPPDVWHEISPNWPW